MRREEFEAKKFIYPRGDWRCFACLKEMRNLDALAEDAEEVYLICQPCRVRTARSLTEAGTLKNL